MNKFLLILFVVFFGGVFILNMVVINNKNKYKQIKKKTWRENCKKAEEVKNNNL